MRAHRHGHKKSYRTEYVGIIWIHSVDDPRNAKSGLSNSFYFFLSFTYDPFISRFISRRLSNEVWLATARENIDSRFMRSSFIVAPFCSISSYDGLPLVNSLLRRSTTHRRFMNDYIKNSSAFSVASLPFESSDRSDRLQEIRSAIEIVIDRINLRTFYSLQLETTEGKHGNY